MVVFCLSTSFRLRLLKSDRESSKPFKLYLTGTAKQGLLIAGFRGERPLPPK